MHQEDCHRRQRNIEVLIGAIARGFKDEFVLQSGGEAGLSKKSRHTLGHLEDIGPNSIGLAKTCIRDSHFSTARFGSLFKPQWLSWQRAFGDSPHPPNHFTSPTSPNIQFLPHHKRSLHSPPSRPDFGTFPSAHRSIIH